MCGINGFNFSNKALLESMQETAMVGADVFNWTHPKSSTVYSVRLAEPIEFRHQSGDTTKWMAFIKIEEE